jgi:hypothetical protein
MILRLYLGVYAGVFHKNEGAEFGLVE